MSLLKLVSDSKEGRWGLVVVFTLLARSAHATRLNGVEERGSRLIETLGWRLDQLYACLVIAVSEFSPDGRSCCVPC